MEAPSASDGNLCPLLKKTVTLAFRDDLYGPETGQIPPVLPLAVTVVEVSLIRFSPSIRSYWLHSVARKVGTAIRATIKTFTENQVHHSAGSLKQHRLPIREVGSLSEAKQFFAYCDNSMLGRHVQGNVASVM